MRILRYALASIFVAAASQAFAQSTAEPVVTGYLTTSGCPATQTVCFVQYGSGGGSNVSVGTVSGSTQPTGATQLGYYFGGVFTAVTPSNGLPGTLTGSDTFSFPTQCNGFTGQDGLLACSTYLLEQMAGQTSVGIQATTSGGWTPFHSTTLTATVTNIKTTAGQVAGWTLNNTGFASPCTIQFFNALSSNVTLGTTAPFLTATVPANGVSNISISAGVAFGTAISVAETSTEGGSSACSTLMGVNIWYD